MKTRSKRSSGNVFLDIGFPPYEAQNLRVRADLMIDVNRAITTRGLTQAAAAKLLGVHPPRASDLMRGRIEIFSIETLIDMLARLGLSVKIVTGHSRQRAGAA